MFRDGHQFGCKMFMSQFVCVCYGYIFFCCLPEWISYLLVTNKIMYNFCIPNCFAPKTTRSKICSRVSRNIWIFFHRIGGKAIATEDSPLICIWMKKKPLMSFTSQLQRDCIWNKGRAYALTASRVNSQKGVMSLTAKCRALFWRASITNSRDDSA